MRRKSTQSLKACLHTRIYLIRHGKQNAAYRVSRFLTHTLTGSEIWLYNLNLRREPVRVLPPTTTFAFYHVCPP